MSRPARSPFRASLAPVVVGGVAILACVFLIFEVIRILWVPSPFSALYAARGVVASFSLLAWGTYCVRRTSRQHERELEGLIDARTRELRESESKLRRLFDADMIGILYWNVDGAIEDANDAFLRVVGYSRADLRAGRLRWRDLTPPEHAAADDRALQEIAERGACAPFEKEYLRKDGSRAPILLGAACFEGDRRRGVSFVLDLSGRRALELQLQQSQKLEAVGRLAGGIAHDFNNVLTAVGGFAELAALKVQGHPAEEELREISAGVRRAGDLTRQLLAFSRRQVLQPRIISVNEVASALEKMLRRLLGEHVELVSHLDPSLGPARVDPAQLEQVLVNLAVNARDAMPRGGRLTLETRNVELDAQYAAGRPEVRPGPYVLVAITDTGSGMDAATLARIFEPFFTTKPKGRGTGLGLSTVYGIVKQSGGHIAAYSELGKGTTFKVYLPRVEGPIEQLRRETDRRELPRGKETVLLVEDEASVRAVAGTVLSNLGYRVLVAAGSEEALKVSEPFDLLLTDLVMPGMSGRQLAERFAAKRPGLRILYMSGYTENAIVHHGELDPGILFLAKPFTSAELARAVRDALDRPRA